MKFENKNLVSILIYFNFNNYAFSDDEKKCIVLARETIPILTRMTTFIKANQMIRRILLTDMAANVT